MSPADLKCLIAKPPSEVLKGPKSRGSSRGTRDMGSHADGPDPMSQHAGCTRALNEASSVRLQDSGVQIDVHNTTRFAGQCSTGPSKHDATYPAFLRIGSTDARDHEEEPPNGNQCSHPETQHWLIDRDGVTPLARVLWSRHRIALQAPSVASANRRLRSA